MFNAQPLDARLHCPRHQVLFHLSCETRRRGCVGTRDYSQWSSQSALKTDRPSKAGQSGAMAPDWNRAPTDPTPAEPTQSCSALLSSLNAGARSTARAHRGHLRVLRETRRPSIEVPLEGFCKLLLNLAVWTGLGAMRENSRLLAAGQQEQGPS